jgi:hypothetical protein
LPTVIDKSDEKAVLFPTPQLPVQGTVLNRPGNVVAANGFRVRQILSLICDRNSPEGEPP